MKHTAGLLLRSHLSNEIFLRNLYTVFFSVFAPLLSFGQSLVAYADLEFTDSLEFLILLPLLLGVLRLQACGSCDARDGTQDLTYARQTLYQLSSVP